ncbi:SET domain-containing protein [Gymnopus androsaceus JB14]|uniref:SET domain-containing protein n=1 Tax=Gymnopus androsaceus JB14 TaxID=1447944 RepID=A0A6A4I4G2_9AGAR|nr:SET domain-containing protein [Gymnopus androsaceus JB14]
MNSNLSESIPDDDTADLATLLSETLDLGINEPGAVYEIRSSGDKGLGAFALKPLRRGERILVETPLVSVDDLLPKNVFMGFQQLSPRDLSRCLLLRNVHPKDGIFLGIYNTNAFPQSGVVFNASRFNHSCSPNARYTYHEPLKQERISALTDIAEGEEIFVSYLQSRNVYGSPHAIRRQTLLSKYRFCCECVACDDLNYQQSDQRRQEIGKIWDTLPRLTDGRTALISVVKAITLMREDGYLGDADDFATDAAALCAGHSDWESCEYWARVAYENRAAEFGDDHPHAQRSREILAQPRDRTNHPQAGMFPRRNFRDIRLP